MKNIFKIKTGNNDPKPKPKPKRDQQPKPKPKRDQLTWTQIIIAMWIVLIGIFMLLGPYYEMKTFNKFSTKKATYLDAVFSQLRIQAIEGDK